jgi:hypothetical protein
MGKPVARLLQPSPKMQKPLTRAEAECKLAEVLGKGNRDLHARYVRRRTYRLSISDLRFLAVSFKQGNKFDFENKLERITDYSIYRLPEGRIEPQLFD